MKNFTVSFTWEDKSQSIFEVTATDKFDALKKGFVESMPEDSKATEIEFQNSDDFPESYEELVETCADDNIIIDVVETEFYKPKNVVSAFEAYLQSIKANKSNVPFDKFKEELMKTAADFGALSMLIEGNKNNLKAFIESNSMNEFENIVKAHNQKMKIEMDEMELSHIKEMMVFLDAIVALK